jgi:hypothetical protein
MRRVSRLLRGCRELLVMYTFIGLVSRRSRGEARRDQDSCERYCWIEVKQTRQDYICMTAYV